MIILRKLLFNNEVQSTTDRTCVGRYEYSNRVSLIYVLKHSQVAWQFQTSL